ncbi:MAG: NAD-dependent epimerase/dehydratase family protein [bacterium]|nr:NAD-dependent epimerase/dehydratase family protein [bacterium]
MQIAQPVLVTGGTGFIGRRLIDRLLEMNLEVVSFALPGEPVPDHWGEKVKLLRGDITKAEDVRAAMAGIQTVFHLAAVVGMGAYDVHWAVTVEGSRNVYDAALANGTKVVLASSIVVYGDQIQNGICHEGLDHGSHQGAYSRAKMAQEKLALAYRADRGLDLVVVRPANVYGVGSGPWVEGMLGLIQTDMLPVVGDGSGNAGLVHVNNLVDAFLLAAGDPIVLPARSLGIDRPDLVLAGIAAGLLVLDRIYQAGGLQTIGGGMHVGVVEDFHTQMIETLVGLGVLEQHELEGRFLDGEVRIAGLALVGLYVEELRVELHGLVEILDVQCELDTHV